MTANEALRRVLDLTLPLDAPINEGEADDMIDELERLGFKLVSTSPEAQQDRGR